MLTNCLQKVYKLVLKSLKSENGMVSTPGKILLLWFWILSKRLKNIISSSISFYCKMSTFRKIK